MTYCEILLNWSTRAMQPGEGLAEIRLIVFEARRKDSPRQGQVQTKRGQHAEDHTRHHVGLRMDGACRAADLILR